MRGKYKISVIAVILLLFSLSPVLFAQAGRGNGRVAGTVKDKDGNPIPGVKITLELLSGVSSGARKMLGDALNTSFEQEGKTTKTVEGGFVLECISDKKGKWGILGFATGEFRFSVEKEGYIPIVKTLRLTQMRRNPLIPIVLEKPGKIEPEKVEDLSRKGFSTGNALYKAGKYKEALPHFKKYVEEHPDKYKPAVNLGNCYMSLKQYAEAVETFKKVIEGFKKENPDLKGNTQVATIYANIGEAYSAMNNLDEAAGYYKKSMETAPPTDAAVAYNVAEILFNGGKTDGAIEYYSLAAKLKPEIAVYYSKLGYAYLNKGDIAAAVSSFETFVKLAPDDPQTPALKKLIGDLKQ